MLLKRFINLQSNLLGTTRQVHLSFNLMTILNFARKIGRTAALATAVQAALLLPDADYRFRERHIFMIKTAAAEELQKDIGETTTPPARDPERAVEEEYQMARQRGTVEAFELFIARHPDSDLAKKARAHLQRLSR